MNVKVVAIFALDTIGSVFAQAKFVSSFSVSECDASARLRENGENASLAYRNKKGKAADGRLKSGTSTKHGSLTCPNKNGKRLCGLLEIHVLRVEPHGWISRSSRMRYLF